MSNPQFSVKSIFGHALELDSRDERGRYLDEACGPDATLRSEVEQLIDAVGRAGDFLGGEPPPAASLQAAAIGTQIGPYKLQELIGEGGMGLVYRAEQQQPVRRQVALKIIKPGMDSRQVIARFEAERQALALMDHPIIARVLDGGETAGRPYFVMELVPGLPITQFCDERGLPAAGRLELLVQVCHAVQHAHQKGIIHRDLKPSNVLVALADGRPAPKVIDFGVAKAIDQKLTDGTLHTQHGMLLGTLEYMSPEQADLSPAGVDTRSDIYSLGVLLYELLTGTTPFDKERLKRAGFDEIRRIIREEEPETVSKRLARTRRVGSAHQPSPAELAHIDLGGHSPPYGRLSELDWIVARCLEKDRNRRYESASALAADVERYLANEPVLAVPPSAGYRLRKFARRNRGAIAVAAGVLLALAVIAACIGWTVRDVAARRAESEQAEATRRSAVAGQVRDSLHAARTLIAENNLSAARQKLTLAKTQLGNDRQWLADLAGEVDAGAAELDRYQQFLDLIDRALQAETSPLEAAAGAELPATGENLLDRQLDGKFAASARLRLEALQLYAVLERDDFSSAWQGGLLAEPQVQQLRLLTYETLVNLACGIAHRRRDPRSGERLLPAAAARQALDCLEKAALARPPTHVLYVLRAAYHDQLGDAAAAEADRQRAAKTPPAIALDYLLEGNLAREAGRLADAVRDYESALRLEPTHYWSLVQLGSCLCDLGQGRDLDEAARIFTGCILHRPDNAHAYRCRGVAYGRLGRYAAAEADCTRAIELNPTYARAWNDRGVVRDALGQPQQALADISRAIELDPQEARAWNQRGGVYGKLDRPQAALADFSQAIALSPEWSRAWSNRGVAYAQLGRRAEAEADFAKAIVLDPKSPQAWFSRGYAYRKLGESDRAVSDLSQAIALNPKLVAAWDNRGLAYADKALPGKAISDFNRAIELDPQHAIAWYHRGNMFVMLRQFERAVAEYSKAIELDSKYVSALNNRGAAYLKLGQPDKAVADCSQAVELAPQNRGHWQTLGTAHYRAGDWQAAATAFSRSVELGQGGNSLDWHFLAMARSQLGNAGEARQAFDRAQQWLAKNEDALKKDVDFADELRRIQAEAEQVLELKKN